MEPRGLPARTPDGHRPRPDAGGGVAVRSRARTGRPPRTEPELRADQRHPDRVQRAGRIRTRSARRGRAGADQGDGSRAGLPDPAPATSPTPRSRGPRHGDRGAEGRGRGATSTSSGERTTSSRRGHEYLGRVRRRPCCRASTTAATSWAGNVLDFKAGKSRASAGTSRNGRARRGAARQQHPSRRMPTCPVGGLIRSGARYPMTERRP